MPSQSEKTATLLQRIPAFMQDAVWKSGDYQSLCGDFVQKHVGPCVSMLVERLRAADGFEDELEKLLPVQDHVRACLESDVCLAQTEAGEWFNFQWTDTDEFPVDKKTGSCAVNFEKFAHANGLRLEDWVWDNDFKTLIHNSRMPAENPPEVERDDLIRRMLASKKSDVGDVINFLAEAAEIFVGKPELASKLKMPKNYQALFEEFLEPGDGYGRELFDTEKAAAEDACENYGIDPIEAEIFEYWIVDGDMARWLEKSGEVVARDFADALTVWGRTTTGQSISMDGEISDIVNERYAHEIEQIIHKLFPHLESGDENNQGVPIDMLVALEQGRVKMLKATYTSERTTRDATAMIVLSNKPDSNAAWVLERGYEASGQKSGFTSMIAVALQNLPELLLGREDASKIASSTEDLDNASKLHLMHGIASFHGRNKNSSMHKKPENLEQRLSAIDPSYNKSTGPSMG